MVELKGGKPKPNPSPDPFRQWLVGYRHEVEESRKPAERHRTTLDLALDNAIRAIERTQSRLAVLE